MDSLLFYTKIEDDLIVDLLIGLFNLIYINMESVAALVCSIVNFCFFISGTGVSTSFKNFHFSLIHDDNKNDSKDEKKDV